MADESNQVETPFTIDGQDFLLMPLRVDVQIATWSQLVSIISPSAMVQGKNVTADDVRAALKMTKDAIVEIPRLLDLFAAKTKWRPEGSDAKFQQLSNVIQIVFQRKPLRLIEYLVCCLEAEFADFLDADGRDRVGARVNGLMSRIRSAGPSKGS